MIFCITFDPHREVRLTQAFRQWLLKNPHIDVVEDVTVVSLHNRFTLRADVQRGRDVLEAFKQSLAEVHPSPEGGRACLICGEEMQPGTGCPACDPADDLAEGPACANCGGPVLDGDHLLCEECDPADY